MNRYLCKCGRAVNKSTNADNTGNRETEGCEQNMRPNSTARNERTRMPLR